MIQNTKTTIESCEFFVEGMHCASCEILIEQTLTEHEKVSKAKANLSNQKVSLQLDGDFDKQNLLNELSMMLEGSGYKLHSEPVNKTIINYKEFGLAFLISLIIVSGFYALQKMGVVNLLNSSQVTYPFVFLIGIVASLSTCMAVVGGLVLSISSSYVKAENGKNISPILNFHISRIVSFFILGGLIGILGSAFTLTQQISFALNLFLFFVMVVLGINLLDIFPFFKKLQISMPKIFSRGIFSNQKTQNTLTPVILGASTFFLPCGFTQSMQIYSLTTGSFISGALTMLVFALGTLPVLSLISFASVKLSKGLQSGLFFKTAGLLVIFFAIFNFLGALSAIGLIRPLFNF